MHDPNDKDHWVEAGAEQEWSTVRRLQEAGLMVMIHPAKAKSPWAIDALWAKPADIKVVRTPFYTAQRYGVPPSYAVTINDGPLSKYKPYSDILFDVQWKAEPERDVEARNEIYCISVNQILSRPRPQLVYESRGDEGDRNNPTSLVLDVREMACVHRSN